MSQPVFVTEINAPGVIKHLQKNINTTQQKWWFSQNALQGPAHAKLKTETP